ncbi:MAG TPA: hypothetical protein ENJ95_04620 [Bacteroidetes bacterium]|nr:hypothetical protein [Bacteroidota bacterium]
MQNKQAQTGPGPHPLFSQLQIGEIEGLLRKYLADFDRDGLRDKKDKVFALLKRLNEDCMLPVVHFERLTILSLKKETEGLGTAEQEELAAIKTEEEKLQSQRIKVIEKLAATKGVSLQELAEEIRLLEY